MADPIAHSLSEMLSRLSPALHPEVYLFATFPDGEPPGHATEAAVGWFREAEGISLILPLDVAHSLACTDGCPMRQITLEVNSSLDGVGLTAAVAGRLARHSIACNVVAAFHHDHLFIPADRAEDALALLQQLQGGAA